MPGLSLYRGGGKKRRHGTLVATQICDATVAPQNIRFPQDTSLLNEARVKLEDMIDFFCGKYGLEKPRTYRKVAHKEYLTFAKSKKPSADKVRAAVKAQLSYVRRDLEYIDSFMRQGYAPDKKYADNIITIHRLYEQQKYMFDSNVHKVDNRIVSISQPYVRPIMRGKANRPTEFGAKLHLSIDERGKISLSIKQAEPRPQGGRRQGNYGGRQHGGRPQGNKGGSDSFEWGRKQPSSDNFDDMLSKFMASSDEKISGMKKDNRRSRRGGNNGGQNQW